MMKKQNRLTILITVTLLCILVIFSTIMVGCNKRDEGRVEAPDVTDDVPEPENPEEQEEEKEEPEDEEKEEEEEKPEEPKEPEATAPVTPPATPTTPTNPGTSTTPQKPVTPTKPVTYDDVIFNKAGTYSQSMVYNNGTVKKGGVLIKNKTFKGDVVIESAVGKGDVSFNNVIIEGTLYVYGGGSNSVDLTSCTVNKMVVDREENTVRVVASEKTEVNSILIKDDTILQEKSMTKGFDGFKNVLVDGHRGLKLSLKGLKLNKLTTDSRCKVDLDSRTIVNVFYADAVTEITGLGDIEKLTASVSGVTYETKPEKISTTDGAKRPTKADDDDDDDWDDDDWDDDDWSRPTVSLTAPNSQNVLQGAVLTVEMSTNGTSLGASSSNTNVATVAVEGNKVKITGQNAGQATITVTASRSGYYSRSVSFAVTVADGAPVITMTQGPNREWKQNHEIKFTVTDNGDLTKVCVVDQNNKETTVTGFTNEYKYVVTANGKYTIKAVDREGHESTTEFTIDRIDQEKPVIKELNSSETVVSFAVEDNSKEDCTVTVDNKTIQKNSTTSKYEFQTILNKEHTITVTDKAGNQTVEKITVTESTTNNSLQIVEKAVDKDPARSKQVTFTVNVPAGQTNVEISVTSPTKQKVQAIPGPMPNSLNGYSVTYTFTAEENGQYTITAKDSNNTITTEIIEVAGIDRTAPVISNVGTTGTQIHFTVQDTSTVTVTVKAENGEAVTVSSNGNNYTYETNATATTTYTITATDTAGNVAKATETVKVEAAEPPAPVITVTSTENYTITFTVKNAERVTVNNEPVTAANGSYVYNAPKDVAGTYTITAVNSAGKSTTETVNIKDSTLPAFGEATYSTTAPTSQSVTVTVPVTDASGIESVTVSGGAVVTNTDDKYSFAVTANGTYTVTAKDKSGNTSTKEVHVSNIDQVAPEFKLAVINNEKSFAKEKVVGFMAKDNVGVASVIRSPGNVAMNMSQAEPNRYYFTAKENGVYTITVTDTAGNVTTGEITVSGIDATLPAEPKLENSGTVLTAAQTKETAEEKTFAPENNVFQVKVTQKTGENAGNTVKAQYLPNGQWKDVPAGGIVLEEGTHTVSIRAIDLAGNVSQAQVYSITIQAEKNQEEPKE